MVKKKMKSAKVIGYKRPSWDEYFLELVKVVGTRGTCDRGRSGALAVRENRVLCTGYVGAPQGAPHCDEVGHDLIEVTKDGITTKHCQRTSHAELNLICQAARDGISLKGATIYCNMEPCYTCAKSLINTGIKRVVCWKRYHGAIMSRKVFKLAGVKLEVILDEEQAYANKK